MPFVGQVVEPYSSLFSTLAASSVLYGELTAFHCCTQLISLEGVFSIISLQTLYVLVWVLS